MSHDEVSAARGAVTPGGPIEVTEPIEPVSSNASRRAPLSIAQRSVYAMEEGVARDMEIFDSLSIIAAADKDALRPLVLVNAKAWRSTLLMASGIHGLAVLGVWLSLACLVFVATVEYRHPLNPLASIPPLWGKITLGVLLAATSLGFVRYTAATREKTGHVGWRTTMIGIAIALGGGLLALAGPGAVVRSVAAGIVYGAITGLATSAIASMLGPFVTNWAISRHPDSFFIDRVIYAAYLVDGLEHPWAYVERKERVCSVLEEAAHTFGMYIPRRLRTTDPKGNAWLEREAAMIAAGFRELKKWVYKPAEPTSKELLAHLGRDVVNAIQGHWHEFDRVEPEKLTTAQLGRRAAMMAQAIVQAAVPFLLLQLVQLTPFEFPPEWAERAKVGAFALGALALMLRIDPTIGDRISQATTVLRSVSGKTQ